MRRNATHSLLLLLAALAGEVGLRGAEPQTAAIVLSESSWVRPGPVLLADIATIRTRDESLRAALAKLDLAEAPSPGESLTISRSRVLFRLRLEGFDAGQFHITGTQTRIELANSAAPTDASRPRVQPNRQHRADPAEILPTAATAAQSLSGTSRVASATGAITTTPAATLEAVACRFVTTQLPWPAEDVAFQLVQPIRCLSLEGPIHPAQCRPQIRTPGPPIGRVTVDVTVSVDGQAPVVCPVTLDVRHYESVVTTARPIPQGRTLQREDVYLNRWDVTGMSDYSTRLESVVGTVASRPLSALQLVKGTDVSGAGGKTGDIVVRRQARVDMVCRIGDLRVSARGEALQEGRVGDLIRLQNVESRAVVRGRVISAEEVEVEY